MVVDLRDECEARICHAPVAAMVMVRVTICPFTWRRARSYTFLRERIAEYKNDRTCPVNQCYWRRGVMTLIAAVAKRAGSEDQKIDFKDRNQGTFCRPIWRGRSAHSGRYLGTIPDYSTMVGGAVGSGVKLAGVGRQPSRGLRVFARDILVGILRVTDSKPSHH